MMNLEELQNIARAHKAEQHVISIMQANLPKPKRGKPIATPMAPLIAESVAEGLLKVSRTACQTFVALSRYTPDDDGVIHPKRADIAGKIRLSPTTITRAFAELKAAGLIQRYGYGLILRAKKAS